MNDNSSPVENVLEFITNAFFEVPLSLTPRKKLKSGLKPAKQVITILFEKILLNLTNSVQVLKVMGAVQINVKSKYITLLITLNICKLLFNTKLLGYILVNSISTALKALATPPLVIGKSESAVGVLSHCIGDFSFFIQFL